MPPVFTGPQGVQFRVRSSYMLDSGSGFCEFFGPNPVFKNALIWIRFLDSFVPIQIRFSRMLGPVSGVCEFLGHDPDPVSRMLGYGSGFENSEVRIQVRFSRKAQLLSRLFSKARYGPGFLGL